MAKDMAGNQDNYERFYPHKLKLKTITKMAGKGAASIEQTIIELIYDGQKLDSAVVNELQHTDGYVKPISHA
jgi:hypothetical protein